MTGDDAASTTAAEGTAVPVEVGPDPRARRALAQLLAGPLLAGLHFAVVYLVTEAGCTGDGPGLDALDPPAPTAVTLVATAVATVACLAAAAWAGRQARRERADALVDARPLAAIGAALSLLSALTVLLVGLPALVLDPC